MANLSNINNKFLVTTGGNVLIGQTGAVGSPKLQVDGGATFMGSVSVGVTGAVTDRRFQVTSGTYSSLTATTNQYGVVINPTYASNITNSIYNLYNGPALASGTTLTNLYNLYLEANGVSGSTVTNSYGVYQSGGGDKNYFAGNVGIGTTLPSTKTEILETNNDIYQLTIFNSHVSTTAKTRIGNWANEVKISSNLMQRGGTKTQDDATKASWVLSMGAGPDAFNIQRSNAGSTTLTNYLTIDSLGNSTFAANSTFGGNVKVTGANSLLIRDDGTFIKEDQGLLIGNTSITGASRPIRFFTESLERMRINSDGDVGIGVDDGDIFGRFYGRSVGIGGAAISKLQLDGTSYSGIDLGKGGTRYGEINASDTGLDLSSLGATNLKMYTNATERMRINSSGNVGIGTTSPQNDKLHVETDVSTVYDGNSNQTGGLFVNNIYHEALNTFSQIRLGVSGASGASTVRLVGIEPSQAASDFAIVLRNGSVWGEKLRIKGATGRVGIGTNDPQAALDISSNYSIQGGVRTYAYQGTAAGTTNINLDITVGNEGGQGNVFKIEAGFAHYYAMNYNSVAEWWCTSRGTAVINTYILNAGTTFGGGWSASKPNLTTLRINKSSGTYGGTGKYWVKVTYVPF